MWKVKEVAWKSFCTLCSNEEAIVTLGDEWLPQTAKEERDKISWRFCVMWKKRHERRNVEGVPIGNRSGASFRLKCAVNGRTTKATNK